MECPRPGPASATLSNLFSAGHLLDIIWWLVITVWRPDTEYIPHTTITHRHNNNMLRWDTKYVANSSLYKICHSRHSKLKKSE